MNPVGAPIRRLELWIRLGASAAALPLLLTARHADSPLSDGVLIGALFADGVTWLVTTVLELPSYTAEALIELAVMLGVIGAINACYDLQRPQGSEAEAVCFLAFLGVLTIKLGWWFLRRLDADLRDG